MNVSFPAIDAATGAGLADLDFAQLRQGRLQSLPDPAGQVFAGGVLQSLDVVEVVVVQPVVDRLEFFLDVAEIHHPATGFVGVPGDSEPDMEGMAVQPGALVTLRHIGQAVGRFKMKFLVNFHAFALSGDAGGGCWPALVHWSIYERFYY